MVSVVMSVVLGEIALVIGNCCYYSVCVCVRVGTCYCFFIFFVFRLLLAESALKSFNFEIARKAFVCCSDYQGIQFVKRLQKLTVIPALYYVALYLDRGDLRLKSLPPILNHQSLMYMYIYMYIYIYMYMFIANELSFV